MRDAGDGCMHGLIRDAAYMGLGWRGGWDEGRVGAGPKRRRSTAPKRSAAPPCAASEMMAIRSGSAGRPGKTL
jgi:hypothetical protein